MVSFGTADKGFSIFLSNFLPQLLIIDEGSPFKVSFDNLHMVYTWNMYPLDGTNDVCYISKKLERFIFPQDIYLEQLQILQLNDNDKRKHHSILNNFHCNMRKFDVVG